MGMNSKAMCLAVVCAALLVFLPTPVRCGISIGLIIDNTGSMGNDIAAVSCFIVTLNSNNKI